MTPSPRSASAGRPHVVVVLTDQLRADCVGPGPYGVATPNLDGLAAQGMRFTRAFTPSGLCGPARASIATGLYPHAHGVLTNVSGPDAVAADIRGSVPLLVRSMVDAGYRTGYVGKYHIARHESPVQHGFMREAATDYTFQTDHFGRWRAAAGYPVDRYPIYPVDRWLGGAALYGREVVPLEATPAWYLADTAVELFDELRGEGDPVFLVLSFLGPHWPHMVPEPYWSMYDPADIVPWPSFDDDYTGKPGALAKQLEHFGVAGWTWDDWRPVVASYFASISFHDELIGRFLHALALRGLGDALVVVTADHGDMAGSHRQFNKGPFMYEDVYRIPLIVRWPGVTAPASSSDHFVSNMDIMPTVLAAAAAAAPEDLHGRDLRPILAGTVVDDWRDAFFGQYHGDEQGLYSQRMLRTERYKLVVNCYDVDELYDLDEDPYELHNRAADPVHARLVRSLRRELHAWMEATGDPLASRTAPSLLMEGLLADVT